MTKKVKYLSSILSPVSLGELIDKITILEIKQIHMTGIKLKNVDKELKLLNKILQDKNLEIDIDLINNLKEVNNKLCLSLVTKGAWRSRKEITEQLLTQSFCCKKAPDFE